MPRSRAVLFRIMTFAMVSLSASYLPALDRAPLNPEFLQYQEQLRNKTLITRPADGNGLGYVRRLPQPADFDGDGKTDPAVIDPATSYWRFYSSLYGYDRYYITRKWYSTNATPVCGDYDGDHYTDPMADVEASGEWYILASRYNYGAYLDIWFGL